MHKIDHPERRKYLRLDSVFPVEIYLPGRKDAKSHRLIQAFTRDVSLGGLRLAVNDPDQEFLAAASGQAPIEIAINMPLSRKPIETRVRVAWHEVKQLARHRRLIFGAEYLDISAKDRQRIFVTAQRMKWLPRIGAVSIVILLCLLSAATYSSIQLRSRNEELIKRFYRVQEESEIYGRSAARIGEKYASLKEAIRKNAELSESLRAESEALKSDDPQLLIKERARIEEELAAVADEKGVLEGQLRQISDRQARASKLVGEVKGQRMRLDEAATKNMYQWLKSHRNRLTGLVISFEGDPAIRDWAFTYDQSLASQAFLIHGDREMASQILSFFRNKASRRDGGFMNAYNAMIGNPTEQEVHLGPNIWMAIAAAHYSAKTGEKPYLDMAEKTASWVISMKDAEGGIRGGPGVKWYSTEHNLDAYALFNMLHSITGKEKYRGEMASTLKWIKENTYSAREGGMNRGKGDSTIATDTLAWSIAAIGPATLTAEGMNPDDIMRFAEEHCLVTTTFQRPDGEVVRVKGFDFAKARNVGRGGIVSTEWTAQMIIAYKMMAEYDKGLGDSVKAAEYEAKAEEYAAELDKMIISSPSPSGQGAGCLPYSSQPSADTGHGWRTPSGAQTGSVAGTAYTIFAKRGYNPLSLD